MAIIRRLAVLASLAAALVPALPAQTVDEIVEKHIAAMGGRDAMSKLQSRTVAGTLTTSTPGGDMTGSIEIWVKAPNKTRSLVKIDLSAFGMGQMVMDQRYDGTAGYIIDSMNGNRDMAGGQLAGMKAARFPSPLLDYRENGAKLELGERAKVGERDTVVLTLTPKDGVPMKLYFDAETYDQLKMVQTLDVPQMGGAMEQATEFSDFREVDGVRVPFEMKVSNPAQNMTIKITKIEHNKEVDDRMFEKPAGN